MTSTDIQMQVTHPAIRESLPDLRDIIYSEKLYFLMECHDPLSAAIAIQAGFKGLWASGLSISTSLGFRDANEASWTQVVDVVDRIADLTGAPILVDGDSGFGNFNNARLLAYKLWQRGASGICLEDKGFPKMNSFIGDRHPLADTCEFCGRLRHKGCSPRSEFHAGSPYRSLDCRSRSSRSLGTRARICCRGCRRHPDSFKTVPCGRSPELCGGLGQQLPVLVVPTKYYRTPVEAYRRAQISTVIWANHNLRAAVASMRKVCNRILHEESIAGIEHEVASLEEVFGLLRYNELAAAERKYLPERRPAAVDK